jgi:flagellar motor switch protein FliG
MMSRLTGPQKAAAFLMSIGEEASAALLKNLDTDEIRQVGSYMFAMSEVKMEDAVELMQEFSMRYSVGGDLYTPGDSFFRNLLPNVLGDQAEDVIKRLDKEREEIPFKNVQTLDAKVLAGFIKNEHPQTIAIILAHLTHEKGAQVLAILSEAMQFEVLNRVARLETVPQELVREVDKVLEEELLSVGGKGSSQILGGIQMAAEILNNCDKRTEENILQVMEDHDPEMAEKVRKLMFVFEDLVAVPDTGIREILKEVRNEELTLALKTASEELKKKVFKNLSQRAAQMLEEDLSIMGPVRLSDVEAAQQNVINVARRLEREGKIFLVSGEGGDVLV